MKAIEANYDGLIGPTHNYGGLSAGNLASATNKDQISHPREAALQGLEKMKMLADAGLVQGVLPPQERPFLPLLRDAGFTGTDHQLITKAAVQAPALLRAASSAAAMWTANAATISPSADTNDGRMHASAANLTSMLHRSIEAAQTARALRAAFPDPAHFAIHPALPPQDSFADEGAANHVRLCADHGAPGVELFVYGREAGEAPALRFPARQTLLAAQSLARRHGLDPTRTVFARQSAKAIEAGAFHNDVVCVGARTCLFYHQHAFADTAAMQDDICRAADGLFEPLFVEVAEDEVSLDDAIRSYLFNAMLVAWPGEERLVLIAPDECRQTPSVERYCARLVAGNGPIGRVHFIDVRQSMRNGGGPACLRLRVVMTPAQLKAANGAMRLDAALYQNLKNWINSHYRETLAPADIADPCLLDEGRVALDKLTGLLALGTDFYPFQR